MRFPLPSRLCIGLVFGASALALAQLIAAVPMAVVVDEAILAASLLVLLGSIDYVSTAGRWQREPLTASRKLPAALAIGVPHSISINLINTGTRGWRGELFDGIDSSLRAQGMPRKFNVEAQSSEQISFSVTAAERGLIGFGPVQIRLRSHYGLLDLNVCAGVAEQRRVYPNFAAVSRYAWLAGSRRLAEAGIKALRQRGTGTDFKQLAEYRAGDPIRHVDWKATLKHRKPIVREFQDERDQCIMFLLDCGRRMRTADAQSGIGNTHFDQVLNAMMLLGYVALRQGDSVGVMTFGTPPEKQRMFAPRKGLQALNAMMAAIGDVQPSPTFSDYAMAATDLLRRHHKRSLVVLITNFRDEDASELAPALHLLRTRHLVLLASLREQVVRTLMEQPAIGGANSLQIASAHLYEQSRRDSFARLSAREALMVDTEPRRLGIDLVNRYSAAKRAGLL